MRYENRSSDLKTSAAKFSKPTRCNDRAVRSLSLLDTTDLRELRERRQLSFLVGSGGGYTIPESFADGIEIALFDASPIRRLATIVRRPDGREVPWPSTNDTSNMGSLLGEATLAPEVDIAFGQFLFRPKKFTSSRIVLPSELVEDAFNENGAIYAWLAKLLGERIGRAQNYFFTNGLGGAGQPQGLVTAAVPFAAASSNAISGDDVLKLQTGPDAGYLEDPTTCYMAHPAIISYLLRLKDNAGHYVFPQAEGSRVPVFGGYPAVRNQHMASTIVSGATTILFGQFSKFQIVDFREFETEVYSEAANLAEADLEAIQGVLRLDACLLDAGTHPIVALTH